MANFLDIIGDPQNTMPNGYTNIGHLLRNFGATGRGELDQQNQLRKSQMGLANDQAQYSRGQLQALPPQLSPEVIGGLQKAYEFGRQHATNQLLDQGVPGGFAAEQARTGAQAATLGNEQTRTQTAGMQQGQRIADELHTQNTFDAGTSLGQTGYHNPANFAQVQGVQNDSQRLGLDQQRLAAENQRLQAVQQNELLKGAIDVMNSPNTAFSPQNMQIANELLNRFGINVPQSTDPREAEKQALMDAVAGRRGGGGQAKGGQPVQHQQQPQFEDPTGIDARRGTPPIRQQSAVSTNQGPPALPTLDPQIMQELTRAMNPQMPQIGMSPQDAAALVRQLLSQPR